MNPKIRDSLIRDVGLTPQQADLYILVNVEGRMAPVGMASHLGVDAAKARRMAESLVELGGFIQYDDDIYEAMHPRFTAVNMYRRGCQRRGETFGRNDAVDNIGVALEQPYDEARTNKDGGVP